MDLSSYNLTLQALITILSPIETELWIVQQVRGRVNQWDMMNDEGVSVVLGTYNRLKFLRLTVQSIREELREASFSHEIIVIDGGSTDGTLEWLPKQRDILTIIQHNHGTWQGRPIRGGAGVIS